MWDRRLSYVLLGLYYAVVAVMGIVVVAAMLSGLAGLLFGAGWLALYGGPFERVVAAAMFVFAVFLIVMLVRTVREWRDRGRPYDHLA